LVPVGEATNGATAGPVPVTAATTKRPTNRAIAGLVIAVMLGMAALGLRFALQTVAFRRAQDSKHEVAPGKVEESRPMRPAEWPGLGFLPDDVQAIAGIRVADALQSAAGKALLAHFNLADAKPILGIVPKDIDHLTVGAKLRTLPPRVTAIIHGTVGSAKLSSHNMQKRNDKMLEHGWLRPDGLRVETWRADGKTMVVALLPEDFDHVPETPRSAVPLSDFMERLDPAALAWLVASSDTNDAAIASLTPLLPITDREPWIKLQSLVVSLGVDGPRLTLTAQIRGRDPEVGEAIAKAVAESLRKGGVAASVAVAAEWNTVTCSAEAQQVADWFRKR
jgi:hypothetical protein